MESDTTDQRFAVGLDVGGTNIKAGLIGSDGTLLAKVMRPTRAERGVEAVLADMAALSEEVRAEGGADRANVVGVGIGAPGPLSPSRGVIIKSANLPGFKNVPMRDELARRTGLPARLDNDANAAAYAEFWVGAGRGARDMVLFTLGTGVGAGVIVGGQLLRGHFENAGELGHTIVQPDGRPCPCGQRGCLEQYASANAVALLVIEAARAGARTKLADLPGGIEAATAERVAQAARDGDEVACRIWDGACRHLAIACVNVQHAYNPARIVLGGGMSAAGDMLLAAVRAHVVALRWSLIDDLPEVVLAELANNAGMIGAAGLVLNAVGAPENRSV